MLKKAGILTAGVTAALLAGAPLATAGENPDHDKSSKSDDHDHDKDHDKKHKKHDGDKNITCDAEGGDVMDNEGEGLLAGVGSALDGNAGQIASCNSFLNDNLNDNKLGVDVL